MSERKPVKGDISSLARAVEEAPLAPRVQEFLDSLELDEYEKTAVSDMIDQLRFRGRGVRALPKSPPQIVAWYWA